MQGCYPCDSENDNMSSKALEAAPRWETKRRCEEKKGSAGLIALRLRQQDSKGSGTRQIQALHDQTLQAGDFGAVQPGWVSPLNSPLKLRRQKKVDCEVNPTRPRHAPLHSWAIDWTPGSGRFWFKR